MANEQQVYERLKEVIDPELGINVVDLGLIYEVALDGDAVDIKMTLTTAGCPLHDRMAEGVRSAAERVPGISQARVQVIWSPPWNPSMMSEAAKAALRR